MPRRERKSKSVSPVSDRLPVIDSGIKRNGFRSMHVGTVKAILERMDKMDEMHNQKKSYYQPIPEAPLNDLSNCKRKIGSWDTRKSHRYADVLNADVFHNLELEKMEALRADRQAQLRTSSVSPTQLRFPKAMAHKNSYSPPPPALSLRSRRDPYKGWTKSKDPVSKRFYYFHLPTGKSSWTPPPEYVEDYNAWMAYQRAQQALQDAMEQEGSEYDSDEFDDELHTIDDNEDELQDIAEGNEAGISQPEPAAFSITASAEDAASLTSDTISHEETRVEELTRSPSGRILTDGQDQQRLTLQKGMSGAMLQRKSSGPGSFSLKRGSSNGGLGASYDRSRRRSSVSRRRRSSVGRGPLTLDIAAVALQKNIRRFLAQKLAKKKLEIVEKWETFGHKYPPIVYKVQAQSIRVPTDQLISQAKQQSRQTEEMALQVHKLVQHLWKGPAGSTDDLRSAEYHIEMEALGREPSAQPAFPDFGTYQSTVSPSIQSPKSTRPQLSSVSPTIQSPKSTRPLRSLSPEAIT